MSDKYTTIMDWFEMYGWLVTGALLAFVTSLVRTAKDNEADILESLFCALITLGLSSVLIWLHMPLSLSTFIGAFVGGLGSKWAQQKMINQAELRLSDKFLELEQRINEKEKENDTSN